MKVPREIPIKLVAVNKQYFRAIITIESFIKALSDNSPRQQLLNADATALFVSIRFVQKGVAKWFVYSTTIKANR